jgi:patatin-related protein
MTRTVRIAFPLVLLLAAPLAAHAQEVAQEADLCQSSDSPAIGAGSGGDTRELRLGLVFYGGVSLAIYMHGQTKEVHNLVIASRAHEAGMTREEVEARTRQDVEEYRRFSPTVLAYFDALQDLEETSGVKTRVVVDSIAGTSAGGINGVFLAKALAHDQSEDGLRDLWMTKADIWKLMGGRTRGFFRLLHLAAGLVLPKVRAQPPLDGELMYRWVYDALEDMGPACPGESLVPPDERLRLFVTATDFRGRQRGFVIGDPATGRESEHRAVFDLTFQRHADGAVPDGRKDPFGEEDNPLLAFAARSTSSFPGAFPPIRLPDMEETLCKGRNAIVPCPVTDQYLDEVQRDVFPEYALDKARVDDSWFVDGGVLDNYPFGHVIDDLTSRAPAREVDRRLIYFQPDPAGPPPSAEGEQSAEERERNQKEIAYLQTLWGALSTIARSEPTGDDFDEIQSFNSRVRLAGGIIDRVRKDHATKVTAILGGQKLETMDAAEARKRIDDQLAQDAGLPYAAYQELRTLAVVQQLERNGSRACNLAESLQRSLLTAAIRRWAEEKRLTGPTIDENAQRELREKLDVGYLWRQLRFVGESVNDLYDEVGRDDRARRAELDEAQAALSQRVEETRLVMRGEDASPAMKMEIKKLCDAADATTGVERGFDTAVGRFLDAHRTTIEAIYQASLDYVGSRQEEIRDRLQTDYDEITADWSPDWRRRVYLDYLGFALWDLVLYPYQRLTDAGEFQEVRVVRMAPDDASALGEGTASTKLGGASKGHFGAFFTRQRREKDYLWGRLDGAERILSVLYGLQEGDQTRDAVAAPPPPVLKTAFLGIVRQEREALPLARPCMDAIEARLGQEGALETKDPKIPEACKAD